MPAAHEAVTYAHALPVVPVRARGLTVEGADGRRYLDCCSGAGGLALGHNHPVVLDALRAVPDSGAPLHAPGLRTPAEDAYAAELTATLPAGLAADGRVVFCGPSRAEAVAAALRCARRAAGGGLLVEAVQAEGGTAAAQDDWLRRTRELTAERGVPLLVDETRTGVGRTGAFWGVEHSGVVPDVMVLARSVGGSLPLAVMVHRGDMGRGTGDAGVDGRTGPVTGLGSSPVGAAGPDRAAGGRGNQLALAAGVATLRYVREQGLAAHAARIGERMRARLAELAAARPYVDGVHGRGLLLGLRLVDPASGRPPRRPAPALAAAVRRACLERGLIVGAGGPGSGAVRLLPPLTLTADQADAILDRLADALSAVVPRSSLGVRASARTRPSDARDAARTSAPTPAAAEPGAALAPAPRATARTPAGTPASAPPIAGRTSTDTPASAPPNATRTPASAPPLAASTPTAASAPTGAARAPVPAAGPLPATGPPSPSSPSPGPSERPGAAPPVRDPSRGARQ